MASLLARSTLALWVWIVIIVIGSLIFLTTVALIVRYLILRRRRATFIDTFGDENLPQRKLTLRRGRVVASSNQLSLTGSKFGLDSFGPDESDGNSRAATRSKSPFEWWNALIERSHSRNSQTTQMTQSMTEVSPALLPLASPNRYSMYQRSDMAESTLSLASSSKEDDISTAITELEPTIPSISLRKPPNFSRSFSRSYREDFPSRQQYTLSRIEESSPHTSMISTRHIRNGSHASHRETSSATPSPLPQSSSPPLPQSSTFHQRAQSDQVSSKRSSIYHDTLEIPSRSLDLPTSTRIYNDSTLNFDEPVPVRISAISSQVSFQEIASKNQSRPPSHITALPVPTNSNGLQYWNTRSDLWPVRSSSKKGNVLRKKKLSQSELVNKVAV